MTATEDKTDRKLGKRGYQHARAKGIPGNMETTWNAYLNNITERRHSLPEVPCTFIVSVCVHLSVHFNEINKKGGEWRSNVALKRIACVCGGCTKLLQYFSKKSIVEKWGTF